MRLVGSRLTILVAAAACAVACAPAAAAARPYLNRFNTISTLASHLSPAIVPQPGAHCARPPER